MEKWDIIKSKIDKYKKECSADIVLKQYKEQLSSKEGWVIRDDFNNLTTLKIVIPSSCNARCKFCYLNHEAAYNSKKEAFLDNFIDSLSYIIMQLDKANQKFSIDITGNEPTFDIELLKKVLFKLRGSYLVSLASRITLSTNGFRLKEAIPYLKGIVNYVDISVHDIDKTKRDSIFNTNSPSDTEYKEITTELLKHEILTSSVFVVTEEKDSDFIEKTIEWNNKNNFYSLRVRKNVFIEDSKCFEELVEDTHSNENTKIITKEDNPDSRWSIVSYNGYLIYLLDGVEDTSKVSRGIEYVVHDDGLLYSDFGKKIPIENDDFPIGVVFDKTNIL